MYNSMTLKLILQNKEHQLIDGCIKFIVDGKLIKTLIDKALSGENFNKSQFEEIEKKSTRKKLRTSSVYGDDKFEFEGREA